MRTTVEMPDILFRQLKIVAAQRGESLKDAIRRAVEAEVRNSESKPKNRVSFPILKSSEPETLNLTNEEISDLLA